MTKKYILERTIKYLNKLLNSKTLTKLSEIEEVKILKEELNSMMYEDKRV